MKRPLRAQEFGVETGRPGYMESSEEVQLLPRRGASGGRGRLALSQGLYVCGERLLTQ